MPTTEIAQGLVSLCQNGQFAEAITQYYADEIVSVEPMGEKPESRGLAAVQAKAQWWYDNMEVHSVEVKGPYVNGSEFVVGFKLDVTDKNSGKRTVMDEVGVYTVANDKIVHERFFYGG
jgi:hypothetical protein